MPLSMFFLKKNCFCLMIPHDLHFCPRQWDICNPDMMIMVSSGFKQNLFVIQI